MTQNSLREAWELLVRSCEELNNYFKSKIWGRLERTVKMDQLPPLKKETKETGVWTPFVAQVFVTDFQKPLFLSNLDSKTDKYMKSMEIF